MTAPTNRPISRENYDALLRDRDRLLALAREMAAAILDEHQSGYHDSDCKALDLVGMVDQ